MTKRRKQNLVKLVLGHKVCIQRHDEDLLACMAKLVAGTTPGEIIHCGGFRYRVVDIFHGLPAARPGAEATWRPARVHKYHLVAVLKK